MAKGAATMKPQLVIPMTGVSSRFTAAGYALPKFLLEVDDETVINHVLDMYPDWDDVIFCCNPIHLDDPSLNLEKRLLERRPHGRVVRVEEADKKLGPGWAVLAAAEFLALDRPVVVNYCDFTCYWNPDDLIAELEKSNDGGCIPAYTGFHPHMAFSTSYAYVKLDGDGMVSDIQEKQPWTDTPEKEFASSGTYAFSSGKVLLDALHAQIDEGLTLNGEYYLSLTYKPVLAAGGKVSVLPLQHFMQWGTPQDFEEYCDYSEAIRTWAGRPNYLVEDAGTPTARVVLASGAGKRFREAGYNDSKPMLQLGGITLLETALASTPGSSTVVVGRRDLPDGTRIKEESVRLGAVHIELTELSQGQADSALTGLKSLPSDLPVTIAACDAAPVVKPERFDQLLGDIREDDFIVWVARNYHLAQRSPQQYGWVRLGAEGVITECALKEAPSSFEDAAVIIGNFTFGSRSSAISEIESLMSDDIRVNGEFYLDSLVPRLIERGRRVRALVVDSFVSLGTPLEYESAKYWQSCFHKWSLHPYTLAADTHVPVHARARLDKEFRAFPHD